MDPGQKDGLKPLPSIRVRSHAGLSSLAWTSREPALACALPVTLPSPGGFRQTRPLGLGGVRCCEAATAGHGRPGGASLGGLGQRCSPRAVQFCLYRIRGLRGWDGAVGGRWLFRRKWPVGLLTALGHDQDPSVLQILVMVLPWPCVCAAIPPGLTSHVLGTQCGPRVTSPPPFPLPRTRLRNQRAPGSKPASRGKSRGHWAPSSWCLCLLGPHRHWA